MSNLLHVNRLKSKAIRRGHTPLMLEYGVSPETAPFLVTSSSSVVWVTEAHPGDVVKAAVREMQIGSFFAEIIDAVTAMGRQLQWGNIQPLTVSGLQNCIDHLEFYDFTDLELLVPMLKLPDPMDKFDDDGSIEGDDGVVCSARWDQRLQDVLDTFELPARPSSWVPKDCVIVVPMDRTFVGVATVVAGKKISGIVHNAARGIAIARGFDELADDTSSELPPE